MQIQSKELKIVRFLNFEAAIPTIKNSSVCLGAIKQLENSDKLRGNCYECICSASSCDDNILISCWTCISSNFEITEAYKSVDLNTAIALISNNRKIEKFFFESRSHILLPQGFSSIPEHGKVQYYSDMHPFEPNSA